MHPPAPTLFHVSPAKQKIKLVWPYSDDKKFNGLSFKLKYSDLLNFYGDLEKMIKIKPTNLDKTKEKEKVHDTATELYNKSFENYYNQDNKLSDVKKISSIKNSNLQTKTKRL